MKRLILIVVLLVTGCFYQGVQSVYYVTVETEAIDEDGDGVQDGVSVFLVFKDREFEPVSFYDAECRATIKVYKGDKMVYEEVVLFDSSEMVGRAGGGIVIDSEEVSGTGDIRILVVIEGRGEFRSEKKDVDFG